jgi:hypothetical protein
MVRRASKPKLSEQTLYCQYDSSGYWYAPPAQSRTKEQALCAIENRAEIAALGKLLCFRNTAQFQRIRSDPLPTQSLQLLTGETIYRSNSMQKRSLCKE